MNLSAKDQKPTTIFIHNHLLKLGHYQWDLQLDKTFKNHYTVGINYADYQADRNSLNVLRKTNSRQAFDINKFWVLVQVED